MVNNTLWVPNNNVTLRFTFFVYLFGCTTRTLMKHWKKKQHLIELAIWPLASHLTNLRKQRWTYVWNSPVDHHTWTDQCWLTRKYIFISSEWILDAVWRTNQEWWPIGTDSKWVSRKSILSAWVDEEEDFLVYWHKLDSRRYTEIDIFNYRVSMM